jgi:hypothetical protein
VHVNRTCATQDAPPAPLQVIVAMTSTLDAPARAELARALRLSLDRSPTREQRRVAELGFLAAMLDARAAQLAIAPPARRGAPPAHAHGIGRWRPITFPRVSMEDYDRDRPPGSLSGRRISERFGGSWRWACRSVWGLRQDGRYAGLGQPWRNAVRGQPRMRYSDEECLEAIRACARARERVPTSTVYIVWARERKAAARARGQHARIPDYQCLRRRWGGWRQALAAAALRPIDLAPAAAAGRGAAAAASAAAAGDARITGPVMLDGAAVRRLRGDRGVRDGDLRRAAGMPLSTWRAALAGTVAVDEPVAATIAAMLGTSVEAVALAS